MIQEKFTAGRQLWNRLRGGKWFPLAAAAVYLLIALGQIFAVEMSYSTPSVWQGIPLVNRLVGFATVLLLDVIVLLMVKNVRAAANIGIVITTVFAIVNYYVAEMHGTPFTFVQLQNARTAMNVIGSYRFEITREVALILVLGLFQLAAANVVFRRMAFPRLGALAAAAALAVVMYGSYAGANPVIPKNVVGWSWKESVRVYGYLPCMVKCTIESFDILRVPESYDEAAVETFVEEYEVTEKQGSSPDIIFILNETFYDLNQITDVAADVDYRQYITSLDNTLQGYAIVPCGGGGTNVSEYELMTSNTIYLSPNSNPFNTIDIMGANSFATYLETLGYSTLAAHSEPGLNYARDVAYSALGFDQVHFEADFQDVEYYGNRLYETDESLYRNLIRWYEQMGEDPRLMYLLTIQNHANYDAMTEEDYLVHTTKDFGEYTGSVNEFLTCMYLSDQAFQVLVDYFEDVERDVIICMMGDHSPGFSNDIFDDDYDVDSEELKLRLRSVPYVIWSNHIDLSAQELSERISLTYLAPEVMNIAGLQLSPYYDYMVKLAQDVPIVTSYGTYTTAEGQVYSLSDESAYTQAVNRYLDLAYANMKKSSFMLD